jgi:hypothetical protein
LIASYVLWWPAAALGLRRDGRRLDDGFRSDVLWHEVGVLAQTIARALDLDDDGVVKKPVQQGGGDDGVAKNFAPFREAAIGCEDHRALLVAGVDELEKQISAAGNDQQVADFVDDEQGEPAEEPDLLAQHAFAFGLGERADEIGECAEVDAAAGFDGLDAERALSSLAGNASASAAACEQRRRSIGISGQP